MDLEQEEVSNKTKRALQSDDHNVVIKKARYSLELEMANFFTHELRSDSEIEKILPPEIIIAILRNLIGKDLCNVILVSKYFWMLGTDPSIWPRIAINKAKLLTSDLEDIKEFFVISIPRYKISRLDMSGVTDIPVERLIYILHHSLESNITDINLSGVNLTGMNSDLLGEVVHRSTKVNLNGCKGLIPSRLLTLFTHSSKSITLQQMELEKVDLVSLPVDLITKTIQRLKMVCLKCCGSRLKDCGSSPKFDETDMTAILNAIINSTSLEDVYLIGVVFTPEQSNLMKENASLSKKIYLRDCLCLSDWKIWNEEQDEKRRCQERRRWQMGYGRNYENRFLGPLLER